MVSHAAGMSRIIEGLPTKSSKIRALDAAGYKRAEIARFWTYATSMSGTCWCRDRRKRKERARLNPMAPAMSTRRNCASPKTGASSSRRTCAGRCWSMKPASITARVVDGELRMLTPEAALRSLQRMVQRLCRRVFPSPVS